MGGRASREKGKRGERELARYLTASGLKASRGQQFRGGAGSPDVLVEALPQFHIEVKRCEKLHLWPAMEQAKTDSGTAQIPLVIHRSNRHPWVVVIALDHFLGLCTPSPSI